MTSVPPAARAPAKWDDKAKLLTFSQLLSADEALLILLGVASDAARVAFALAAEMSRTQAGEFFQTPAEQGLPFFVPQLALRIQGELALFDDPEVLDYPWELSAYDAAPTREELNALGLALKVSQGGEIDVDDESGKVTMRFIAELQRDLGLAYRPEHWDEIKLAAWLCRNLPEPSLTHASKQAFVACW